MSYKIERVKKLKNTLETHLLIALTEVIGNANLLKYDHAEFRRVIDMHVNAYRHKFSTKQGACMMSTYWPTSATGQYTGGGSIRRDNDDTPVFRLLTEETI
jgi:hypothetical protein